jgi:hypothetical protein
MRAELDRRPRLALPLRLPDHLHGFLPRGRIHPVDEQHAIQVIGLMLQASLLPADPAAD